MSGLVVAELDGEINMVLPIKFFGNTALVASGIPNSYPLKTGTSEGAEPF